MSDVKFRNKTTKAILIPQSDSIIKHMRESDRYEEIKESASNNNNNNKPKELTVKEIKEKLTELGIEYPNNANKETLLTYLPQKNAETAE